MMMRSDSELLQRYADTGCEDAFSSLVQRHLNLVYSAALRQVRSPDLAREVAQSVFLDLAASARRLKANTILSAWLYNVARRSAIDVVRRESRRQARERIAAEIPMSDDNPERADIAALLDEAMASLNAADRSAILLRYFEARSLRDVGQSLDLSDDAAQKRVSRALERLRRFFVSRGVPITAAVLAAWIAEYSVQAAPMPLAAAIAQASCRSVAQAGGSVAAQSVMPAQTKVACAVLSSIGIVALLTVLGIRELGSAPKSQAVTRSASNESAARPAATQANPAAAPPELFTRTTKLNLQNPIGAVAVQPDGKILVGVGLGGGFFDESTGLFGWYNRPVVRLEPDGSLDPSFNCAANRPDAVTPPGSRITLLKDNRIFVSGAFSILNGKPRHGHAILLPNGDTDDAFDPWRSKPHVSARFDSPRLTYASAVLPDGHIAVMSSAVEGLPPQARTYWSAYLLDGSGRIAGPALTNVEPDIGRPDKLILRFSDMPLGEFPEVTLDLVRYAARLPGGGAVVATREPPYFGSARGTFRRFDTNWNMDVTFTNAFESDRGYGDVTLHVDPQGRLLVAGIVGSLNGEPFSGLARFNNDGSIDRTFRCESETNSVWGRVMSVAWEKDGRMVICGYFSKINGAPAQYIARLNRDGSLDRSFRPFLTWDELTARRVVRLARLSRTLREPATNENVGTNANESSVGTVLIHSMNVVGGMATIRFAGIPNGTYVLQSRDSLNAAEWTTVTTNRADSQGVGLLRDPTAGQQPMRFYRIATP